MQYMVSRVRSPTKDAPNPTYSNIYRKVGQDMKKTNSQRAVESCRVFSSLFNSIGILSYLFLFYCHMAIGQNTGTLWYPCEHQAETFETDKPEWCFHLLFLPTLFEQDYPKWGIFLERPSTTSDWQTMAWLHSLAIDRPRSKHSPGFASSLCMEAVRGDSRVIQVPGIPSLLWNLCRLL